MSTAFIIFAYIIIIPIAVLIGWLIGFEADCEIQRDVFRTWKSNKDAYYKGIKQGFDKGWESAYGYMIEIMELHKK